MQKKFAIRLEWSILKNTKILKILIKIRLLFINWLLSDLTRKLIYGKMFVVLKKLSYQISMGFKIRKEGFKKKKIITRNSEKPLFGWVGFQRESNLECRFKKKLKQLKRKPRTLNLAERSLVSQKLIY